MKEKSPLQAALDKVDFNLPRPYINLTNEELTLLIKTKGRRKGTNVLESLMIESIRRCFKD